jgi:hypothetical protein
VWKTTSVWNHVVPDSGVNISLTVLLCGLWMRFRVRSNNRQGPSPNDGYAPRRDCGFKNCVENRSLGGWPQIEPDSSGPQCKQDSKLRVESTPIRQARRPWGKGFT